MPRPNLPTTHGLIPGDVVYAPGWDYCYAISSGPFCRIHYIRCQGHLAATPSDPPIHVSYLMRALGGTTTARMLVKLPHENRGADQHFIQD